MSQPQTADAAVMPLTKVTHTTVFVTPDMAERWLAQMPRNRRLREADVRRYARDMVAGEWHDTGEAIKFDRENKLIDGQHRLNAIQRAGVTIPILVVRGLPRESQSVMDTGRRRTASDALTLAGHSHSSVLAAAARLGLGVQSGVGDPGRYEASNAEIAEFIDHNPDLAEACATASRLARRTDCPPAVVAYTMWVFTRIDPVAAHDFWASASEKVGLSAGDPVIALTNRFAESRRNRQALSKGVQLSLIYRAWNARRAGTTMRVLRVKSSTGGNVAIPEPR